MTVLIKSVEGMRLRFPTEEAARQFLEEVIWPRGRFCPHCGGLRSWAIKGASARPGLYECRECGGQFTVTTKTPLHGTKLHLRTWLLAIFLVLTSSKGISSVVLARLIGTTQATAWKVAHAIRELMDLRHEVAAALSGIVELDEKYVGGAPKYQRHVYHAPGKGTQKQPVFIAASRNGQVRAAVVEGTSGKHLAPLLQRFVDRSAVVMTDSTSAYNEAIDNFEGHHSVNHSAKEYAWRSNHINTAEAFGAQMQRAQVGVYHKLSNRHLQRYVDEVAFRWNHRRRRVRFTKRKQRKEVWAPLPFEIQAARLMSAAVGRQLRRSGNYGLYWPEPLAPRLQVAPSAITSQGKPPRKTMVVKDGSES